MENTNMVVTGEKLTNDEDTLEALIVLNVYKNSFSLYHSSNIEMKEVYEMYKVALEYMDELMSITKDTPLH